jgi:hypothetical protein
MSEKEEELEKARKLVGRYFKYSNNFGTEESWWLYVFVKGASDRYGSSVSTISFEKDIHGKIQIEDFYKPSQVFKSNNYLEIERAEFLLAWEKIKTEITSYEFPKTGF